MYDIIIKHFFIYFGCIYLYYHLLNIKITSVLQKTIYVLAPAFLSLLTLFFKLRLPGMANIFPVLFLWIIFSCISFQPQVTFVAIIISFGLSYGFSILSNLLLTTLLAPIHLKYSFIPYYGILLLVGFLETSFATVCPFYIL